MSAGRIALLGEKLSAEDLDIAIAFLMALRGRGSNSGGEPAEVAPKSSAAARQKAYRERKSTVTRDASVTSQPVTRDVTRDAGVMPGDVTQPRARALSSLSFSEETAEKKSTGAPANVTVTHTVTPSTVTHNVSQGNVTLRADAFRKVFIAACLKHAPKSYVTKHLGPKPGEGAWEAPHRHFFSIVNDVAQEDWEAVCEGFFASERAREKGFTLAFLANCPAEYLATKKAAPVDVDTLKLPPTLDEAERRAVSAHRAIKRAADPSMCMVTPPNPEVLERAHRKILEAMAS